MTVRSAAPPTVDERLQQHAGFLQMVIATPFAGSDPNATKIAIDAAMTRSIIILPCGNRDVL
jgi:hypothetical protein